MQAASACCEGPVASSDPLPHPKGQANPVAGVVVGSIWTQRMGPRDFPLGARALIPQIAPNALRRRAC